MKKFHTNIANKNYMPVLVLCLFLIGFLSTGGCDVDFGGTNNGSSGGGGGTTEFESVQGTIIDIIPERSIEGITVQVIADGSSVMTISDTTDNSGFFFISGRFSGSPQLDFLDQDLNSLGLVILNVFPTARLELGNIRLENGTVMFEDDTDVTFEGDVIFNNCTDNSGTLEIEAVNGDDELDVIVQVSASTDVVRSNGDDVLCENILIGQTVEVRGFLLIGNSIDASRVEIL